MELVGWLAALLTGMMGWAVDGAGSEDSFFSSSFWLVLAFVATPFVRRILSL